MTGYVYILSNKTHTVLYTGSTNNLIRRVYEHKNKLVPGFTATYSVNQLVYFEDCGNMVNAAQREIQIKAGSRKKKVDLIGSINPTWNDLYNSLL